MPKYIISSSRETSVVDTSSGKTSTIAPGNQKIPATIVIREVTDHPDAPPYSAANSSRLYARDWNELIEALVKGSRTLKIGCIVMDDGATVDGVDVSVLDQIVDELKTDVGMTKTLVRDSLLESGDKIPIVRSALNSLFRDVKTTENFVKDPTDSPDTIVSGIVPAFKMSSSGVSTFYTTFKIKDTILKSLDLELKYFLASSASGDIKITVNFAVLKAGDDTSNKELTTSTLIVSGDTSDNILSEDTISLGEISGLVDGDLLFIQVTRNWEDSEDTSEAHMNIVSMGLTCSSLL